MLLLLLLGIGTILSGSEISLRLYEKNYDNTAAHLLAGKISKAIRHPEQSCLIIGASTAREGFDEVKLEEFIPNMHFYNAGTTGSNIQAYEIMATVMERYNIHVNSIVVPLHAWLMNQGDYSLNSLGYTDLVSLQHAMSLTSKPLTKEFEVGQRKEFILNALFPIKQHARIISRHIRYGLYKLHQVLFKEKSLKVAAFEFTSNELTPSKRYWYSDTQRLSETDIEKIKSGLSRFLSLKGYGQELYAKSLRKALKILSAHSNHLYLVIMPDSTLLDESNRTAMPYFLKLIEEFQAPNIYCVDLSNVLTDNQLRDHTHALPDGRALLTQELASVLNNPHNSCDYRSLSRFKASKDKGSAYG